MIDKRTIRITFGSMTTIITMCVDSTEIQMTNITTQLRDYINQIDPEPTTLEEESFHLAEVTVMSLAATTTLLSNAYSAASYFKLFGPFSSQTPLASTASVS